MGTYINIGNAGFRSARNGEYVDKSGLIPVVNATLDTERRFSCVTRCRRFGKSMAAKMLNAYYDRSCDSSSLFADLEAAKDPGFGEHLNKHPVIYIDMTSFVTRFKENVVRQMDAEVVTDIQKAFPEILVEEGDDLMKYLIRVVDHTGEPFIFIIDEWDAICREFSPGTEAMDGYVNWLRRMFKDVNSSSVFLGVYMTGILPIKKYKTESALNNFSEYSMVEPGDMAQYFGFTKDEVRVLASKYGMDFSELEKWYDGYQLGDEPSMFNPNSVMQAVDLGYLRKHWESAEAFDTLTFYGETYKGAIGNLIDGKRVKGSVDFLNDMFSLKSEGEVLEALVHLGCLCYDKLSEEFYVPNLEILEQMKLMSQVRPVPHTVNGLGIRFED